MNKFNRKTIAKWVLRAGLSLLALYLVFRKIDLDQLMVFFPVLSFKWLFPAFILFNISKLLSAIRLNMLIGDTGLVLDHRKNILLYYLGMFYNLFLPGGIGGDGYKVYLLHRWYGVPANPLIAAVLYDRLNGVAALGIFAALIGMAVIPAWQWYFLAVALTGLPLFYLFTRLLFSRFLPSFFSGNLYSFGVQLMQMAAAVCLLKSIDIPTDGYFPYLLLFLISSIAAALPVSVGGIGARELVFVYGIQYINIFHSNGFIPDIASGVFISMLFFIITALSSFSGVFVSEERLREAQA